MPSKMISYVIGLSLLMGCAGKPLDVRSAPVDLPLPACYFSLPPPDPIKTYSVKWHVIEAGDPPQMYFALSAQGYENLARGQSDTLRWVREASEHLRYYKKQAQN